MQYAYLHYYFLLSLTSKQSDHSIMSLMSTVAFWEVQAVEIEIFQPLLHYSLADTDNYLTGLSTSACQLLGLKSAIQAPHGVAAAQTVGPFFSIL